MSRTKAALAGLLLVASAAAAQAADLAAPTVSPLGTAPAGASLNGPVFTPDGQVVGRLFRLDTRGGATEATVLAATAPDAPGLKVWRSWGLTFLQVPASQIQVADGHLVLRGDAAGAMMRASAD